MASQKERDEKRPLESPQSMRYRTRTTYDTLLRQSRKLGETATQAMTEATRQLKWQPPTRVHRHVDNIGELKKVVAHSHEIIAKATTVLPLLFPHEIILDRTKIIIIRRIFFWSSDVISIRIEDVLNVSGAVGPLFGSVTIASRVMSTVDHFEVDRFWRDDATRMVQIIEGYMIARQNGIETDHLSCQELADVLYGITSSGTSNN